MLKQVPILQAVTWFIGYMLGKQTWFFGEKLEKSSGTIINKRADKTCQVDRKLVTGASPKTVNDVGKLAATMLRSVRAKENSSMQYRAIFLVQHS